MKISTLIAATFLSLMPVAAFAVDQPVVDAASMVPQLNENCSASLIYSKRDEKTGKVKTQLLSAKHCVSDLSANADVILDFAKFENNRVIKKDRFIGHVVGTDWKSDLSLLELNDTNTLFENVNKIGDGSNIVMYDETVAIGYPFGLGITITEGNFMQYVKVNIGGASGNEYMRSTPDIGPGNSGGALFKRFADGHLEQIGVTTAGINGYPFMGLYTSVDAIRDYLKVASPEVLGIKPVVTMTSPAGR